METDHRSMIVHGPDEVDLIYSGLEETMISSLHDLLDTMRENPGIDSMRTAAFVLAIKKISSDYLSLGIWP